MIHYNMITSNSIKLFKSFVFIGFVQFIVDYSTNKELKNCLKTMSSQDEILILSNLLFHHVIISFIHYSWIVDDRFILQFRLTLFCLLCLIIYYYKNKCPITVYINKKCNDNEPFRDLIYLLGYKKNMGTIEGDKRLLNFEIKFYTVLTVINVYKLFVKN